MKATDAIKIMKGFIEASNSEDYEKGASLITDDFEYEDVPSGRVSHGKKGYLDTSKGIHASYPDHKWEMKSAFSDGYKVASESVTSGTFLHSNDPNMPATGKHGSFRSVDIVELRNGKICKITSYYDAVAMLKQAGLLPEAPSKR